MNTTILLNRALNNRQRQMEAKESQKKYDEALKQIQDKFGIILWENSNDGFQWTKTNMVRASGFYPTEVDAIQGLIDGEVNFDKQ